MGADRFEDLPGKWQAAILKAEDNRPKLRRYQRLIADDAESRRLLVATSTCS